MTAAILIAVGCVIGSSFDPYIDHADMVEINHFHTITGDPTFTQVIFWEWYHEHGKYHVREWRMIETVELFYCKSGIRFVEIGDRSLANRIRIIAGSMKESWTQHDPERLDLKTWPETNRRRLVGAGPIRLRIEHHDDEKK